MALSKFLACTMCAFALFATACADGTGKALTPTLPSAENTTNPDGTRLKASTPQPSVPRGSERVSSLTPQLRVATATPTFGIGTLEYDFEVYDGNTRIANVDRISAAASAWSVPANVLAENKTYGWRARATYAGVPGSWSDMALFLTPLPPPPPPAAGSAGGGPVPCAGSSGAAIVACVAAAFPEKLVATAQGSNSDGRRADNMEFMRDRIIETARCKGMDLGRNFKRGTPVISHDFVVLRQPGQRDRGVDIAQGYDDVDHPLRLKFQVFDGPDYGYPYYAGYPPVDCTGIN